MGDPDSDAGGRVAAPQPSELKRAVVWSLVIHAAVLALQLPTKFVPPQNDRPIKVTYLPPPPPKPEPARARKTAPKPAPLVAARPDPAPVPPPPIPVPPKPEPVPPAPAPRPVQSQPVAVKDVPGASSTISSVSDADFALFHHRQQVRQHLKSRLNYPNVLLEGTVRLKLVLLPDGGLEQAVVVESTDARLERAAIEGAFSASPYPRFPRGMKGEPARYEFLVQYKPE